MSTCPAGHSSVPSACGVKADPGKPLTTPPACAPEHLREAVSHLLAHHDALRLRFTRASGMWRQINAAVDASVPFQTSDLSAEAVDEQEAMIAAAAAEWHTSLNLEHGSLIRVIYFNLGGEREGRLLIIIHHLAVDGVSWRILLDDLQTAYNQILQGNETVQLPPKTTSYQQWAHHLQTYAQIIWVNLTRY